MTKIYEIQRHKIGIENMNMAVHLGQLIYRNKYNREDDEIVVEVADMIREGTEIENKIVISGMQIENNIIELMVIEFPIKPDGKVTMQAAYDEDEDKWYIENGGDDL